MRSVRVAALVGTTVLMPLAGLAVSTGVASAGVPKCSYALGATVCFNPVGETLTLCDTAKDGHHVGVWYVRSTSPYVTRTIDDDIGFDNCRTHDLADIPETGWIDFEAFVGEGITIVDRGDWVHDTASND